MRNLIQQMEEKRQQLRLVKTVAMCYIIQHGTGCAVLLGFCDRLHDYGEKEHRHYVGNSEGQHTHAQSDENLHSRVLLQFHQIQRED